MSVLGFVSQCKSAYKLRKDAKQLLAQIEKEGGFYRQQGKIYGQDLQVYLPGVAHLSGTIAEIGVRFGDTFQHLIPFARQQNKAIYAVDSFQGTKQNSVYDSRPDFNMSIGGVDVFLTRMRNRGFLDSEYNTLVGWIPEVFEKFPDDIQFSFVILDVDNYSPTADSLNFVWPRLQSGGLLFCDDFCTYHQVDAGRAIREFLQGRTDYWLERILPNYQVVFRKN